jgi:lysylphosphatidylglycerol synthetase-like protein (DUF2156 family)
MLIGTSGPCEKILKLTGHVTTALVLSVLLLLFASWPGACFSMFKVVVLGLRNVLESFTSFDWPANPSDLVVSFSARSLFAISASSVGVNLLLAAVLRAQLLPHPELWGFSKGRSLRAAWTLRKGEIREVLVG